jgi:putative DNA primase/helicase
LAAYLQKVLGYCLTGKVNEHLMFIAIGSGANGKNVLLDTFKAISGDYSESISPEVLMCSKFDSGAEQASPSARKLAGARCAISSESKDGQRLDVAIVKRHTGGGMMTARALHENPITFEITHKLWLMTNHTPRVDHMDDATKGRLHVIPFDMKWNRPGEVNPNPSLPNADKNLIDTLKSEYPGILNWLIQGAFKYHAEGLSPPDEVVAFTRSYIESQDLLERWLREECTRCDADSGMLSADLLRFYEAFCNEEEADAAGH